MKKAKRKIRFRLPLWVKAILVLVFSVAAVSGAAIGFFKSSITNMTRSHYVEHSIEIADTLGVFLNQNDIKAVKAKVDSIYKSIPEEEKVENSSWGEPEWETYLDKYSEVVEMKEYKSLFDQISTFHSKNEAKFTSLTYADLDKQRLIYLVDDADIEERCLPGSFDDFTESDMSIYDHLNEGFTPEISNMPEYGYLASVGRPVFDENKEIIAFTIVDLSMDNIIAKENENARTLIIILVSISVGTVLIGFALVLLLIARPLRILTHAAKEYTTGNDGELNKFAKVRIRTKDEIEDLSNSMKTMEEDINRYIIEKLGAEKKADEMKSLAVKDALTGMNNKRSYFEAEERINEEIRLGKAKFAITMIDLNDLKVINDNLGHEKGDEAIVNIAKAINETYLHSLTYRVGGDEFVAISENEDLEVAQKLVKELRANISKKDEKLTAAIGVAIFDPKKDNTFEDTFKRADSKMYANKKEMKK